MWTPRGWALLREPRQQCGAHTQGTKPRKSQNVSCGDGTAPPRLPGALALP